MGGRIALHLAEHCSEIQLRLTTRRGPGRVPDWAGSMEVVQADVLEPTSLDSAVEGMDAVIHLAAVDEIVSAQTPLLALDVNVKGTYFLLESCRRAGVKQFIYFSTFHVYGPWARNPIKETTPTRPVNPYAFTHRAAEDLVNWYRHAFGFETLILRLSNGYGYPADPFVNQWSRVCNDLCRQAVENQELVLNSSGRQERDFIALSDVGEAVRHLITIGPQSWQDGLFNLGGGNSLSIRQVAEIVATEYQKRYGQEIPITFGSDSPGTEKESVEFDIGKLKNTGFRPAGAIGEEVQGTLALCEKLVEIREKSVLQ